MRLFVTGATGFLGYHFVCEAVKQGHEVLCLRRKSSVSLFDETTEKYISWAVDDYQLSKTIKDFAPEVLIHAAWGGVRGSGRENKDIQIDNLKMSERIFKLFPYRQIIVLGSQAEYGYYEGPVSETHPLQYNNEYGCYKNKCRMMLQEHCEANHIEWQWIRIFTVFGEKQSAGLINAFVKACNEGKQEFPTSPGQQVYAYMYAADFAKSLCHVLGINGKSGIYNLSQPNDRYSNQKILEILKSKMQSPISILYGALPYPTDQVMLMDGDVSRFEQAFGPIPHSDFDQSLNRTIESLQR
jgi:nucleoside-diphosphate-sugar epimerase